MEEKIQETRILCNYYIRQHSRKISRAAVWYDGLYFMNLKKNCKHLSQMSLSPDITNTCQENFKTSIIIITCIEAAQGYIYVAGALMVNKESYQVLALTFFLHWWLDTYYWASALFFPVKFDQHWSIIFKHLISYCYASADRILYYERIIILLAAQYI